MLSLLLSLLFPLCFFSIVGVVPCLSFCVFSEGKGYGRLESNQQKRFPTPREVIPFKGTRCNRSPVQSPCCSQGTPIPSLSLSRVTVGAVFLAPD